MEQRILTIKSNRAIAEDTYELKLTGAVLQAPGTFVNIKIEGLFLRRPISVCDYNNGELTLVFKVVGKGTDILSKMPVNMPIDALLGLGNGYDLSLKTEKPLLIGGGLGVPPMYYLAKKLLSLGKKPQVVLGFNSKAQAFYIDEFSSLAPTTVMTVDGSLGKKGFVTDAFDSCDYFYACGPFAMLKALSQKANGEVSLEERMGCGFGACMGCSIETKNGYKRVCKDGPCFKTEELLWN